jgi:hypothetical protein
MRLLAVAFIALALTSCGSSEKDPIDRDPVTNEQAKPSPSNSSAPSKAGASSKDAAGAGSTAAAAPSSAVCSFQDIRRELKVLRESGTCRVEYVKDGETKELASGQENSPICQEVFDRVKNNLVSAGYSCK